MIDIEKIITIAKELGLENIVAELEFYKARIQSTDKDLILPLVGEFSSGKTSLINSLLDNPNLETASRATTASIFEVRFGADSCYAEIVNKEGYVENVHDVSEIKNSTLTDVNMVRVYDTSSRIGSSTILVDTPGLSSNDPMHRIALSSYLPKADAILLLTDINQQITRSLLDFMSSSQICKCPVYLVITKCDTKTPNEIEQAKEYIRKNIDFKFASIIAISSTAGIMDDFDKLITQIQQDKNAIVEHSVNNRVKNIAAEILNVIQNLLNQSNNIDDINKSIQKNEDNLRKMGRSIDVLIHEAQDRIEENTEAYYKQFRSLVFPQLDSIVKNQGRDCDQAVYGAVNSCGTMIIQNFRRDTINDVINLAHQRKSELGDIPLNSLETISLSEQAFNGFTYNVKLASAGHNFDKAIGYGILGAAAIILTCGAAGAAAAAGGTTTAGSAAAAGGAATAGGAAAAGGAATAGGDAAAGTATVVATDIATDVAATAYTAHKINKLHKISSIITATGEIANKVSGKYEKIKTDNQAIADRIGMKRGFIETSVGWVTEYFAKPARQKAVNEYIDGTLLPELRLELINLGNNILRDISTLINQESQIAAEAIRNNLETMKSNLTDMKEEYTRRKDMYTEYSELLKQYIS